MRECAACLLILTTLLLIALTAQTSWLLSSIDMEGPKPQPQATPHAQLAVEYNDSMMCVTGMISHITLLLECHFTGIRPSCDCSHAGIKSYTIVPQGIERRLITCAIFTMVKCRDAGAVSRSNPDTRETKHLSLKPPSLHNAIFAQQNSAPVAYLCR